MGDADVLIVGGGLSGLTAARALHAAGRSVAVVDKGAGAGGRLATRRIMGAVLDHGAQFFTVRSDEFARLVGSWEALGAPIERWSNGFAQATDVRDGPAGVTSTGGDGHPRYAVHGGMNALAGVLAADGPTVVADTRATAAWVRDGRWHVATSGPGGTVVRRGRSLVCTPPVPQSLALFVRGATTLPDGLSGPLRSVAYDPCLALLAVLDAPPAVPDPGGVQFSDGPVRWLADNARKPVSDRPAITVHAAGGWSADHWDAGDDEVAATLEAWLQPWLGGAEVVAAQLKRWRYAQPVEVLDRPTLAGRVGGAHLAFAGDAFGHARVEGAALSGLAAARALLG